jgi:hypothetical protein
VDSLLGVSDFPLVLFAHLSIMIAVLLETVLERK